MYTIRKGTTEDFNSVSEIIKSFAEESLNEYGFKFSPERASQTILAYVDNSLVLEIDSKVVGVIAGHPAVNFIDGTPLFQEVVWYVLPSYRKHGIRLLRKFEQLVKESGFKSLVVAQMGNLKFDKLRNFYERSGYKMMEVQYIKEL